MDVGVVVGLLLLLVGLICTTVGLRTSRRTADQGSFRRLMVVASTFYFLGAITLLIVSVS